jgi:SEC-C motif domain protein
MTDEQCLCNSGSSFSKCCQPYLDGTKEAPDPESLMRSRYSAFIKKDFEYLKRTWHPETLPELDENEPSNWISLEIVETAIDESGSYGEVEFIAKVVVENRLETLHEVSDFEKVDGRWFYHSGEFKNDPDTFQVISMKAPCPCGSGEKFKHCHYRS